jgi:PAS domain S-box-containing protein
MQHIEKFIEESKIKLDFSEHKFKLLFELSPLGMAMVDYETGEFLEVNEALLNFTGYTKEEFLQLSFWDITPKKYEAQEREQMNALNATGRFGPNEKEYIKKDGSRLPIKISGFSLMDTNGRKVVWGLIEDITQFKEYEIIYEDNKELLEYVAIESSLQEVLNKIVALAQKRNPQTKCSILLLDESKQHLLTGAAPSLPKFYNDAVHGVKIGDNVGSCGSATFNKKRVIVENINTHENWQPYLALTQKANLHACWSQPIISSTNEALGSFAIYNSTPKTPSSFELKLIETYANIAAKAIEKHQYIDRINRCQRASKESRNDVPPI